MYTISHVLDIIVSLVLEAALVFAAFMFRKSYITTKDRAGFVLAVVFVLAAVLKLPEVVFNHILQIHIPILESMRDILFVFVIIAIAWALWPRTAWKKRLKDKGPVEQ